MESNYAWVSHIPRSVAVGNIHSCHDIGVSPLIRLHIWSNDSSPGWPCTVPAGPKDYRLEYKDGGALSGHVLDNIRSWLQTLPTDNTPLLIHCGAGQCRAPTLTVVVLAVFRNVHPMQVIPCIHQPLYEQRHIIADIRLAALDSIVKWWESKTISEVK